MVLRPPMSNAARPPMTWEQSSGIDVDAAVSVRGHAPDYEVGAVFSGRNRSLTVGYTQSHTIRRKVYNPLEPGHVKGIYSYADMGLSYTQPIDVGVGGRTPELRVGGSFQLNRGVLLKAKVGTHDSGVAAVLCHRGDPSVSLGASVRLRSEDLLPRVGLSLTVDSTPRI